MKRDLDLIRKILLAVEASPHGFAEDELAVPGYSPEQIGYHSYLLVDAGLAEGRDATHLQSTGPDYRILHLTSAGHDFVDAARDEAIWKRATTVAVEKTSSISLDVLKQLLIAMIKSTLGL